MRMKQLIIGGFCIVSAIALLRRPKCNRGCKTLAEHLLTDGLDEILAGILA